MAMPVGCTDKIIVGVAAGLILTTIPDKSKTFFSQNKKNKIIYSNVPATSGDQKTILL